MPHDIVFRNLDSSVVIGVRLRTGYQRNGTIPNSDKDNSLLLKGPVLPHVHTTSNQRVLESLPGGFIWSGRRAD
jgi:hypothetical protein